MSEEFFVVSLEQHNTLITKAYQKRGYHADEARAAAEFAGYTAWHGIRTHNALKALHLDDHFGSGAGGCIPGAQIEKQESRFPGSQVWNANRKLGQAVALEAVEECITLADKFGIAQVSVDNAFHYLWGGGYVMQAAKRGYIAYTCCTAALAEVVPFGGKFPSLGTNPHSWGFPTVNAVGYPVVIDWATSIVAMGRVQQLAREGKPMPPNAGVDKNGCYTTDPNEVVALTPFGAHKGYGLSLINEIYGGLIGGSLPTLRSRWNQQPDEKHTPNFYFQVIHPDALSSGSFVKARSQSENLAVVLEDIRGHGNENCLLPGQIEATAAKRCEDKGGLLFSQAELDAFSEIAKECDEKPLDKIV